VTATPLQHLVRILDLERIEVDIFRGTQPETNMQRVFGGQVAGQALVAAGRTVDPSRPVHSLHAYFLRPGDPSIPIIYEVDRIRDGKSFTTRRVVAVQHGKAIFNLQASFQLVEGGLQHTRKMPTVPGPDADLLSMDEVIATRSDNLGAQQPGTNPIDIRYIDPPAGFTGPDDKHPRSRVWMRADGRLPDDPLLHVCAVAFASDFTLLGVALRPHDLWFGSDIQMASLDHAMWFHRPFRADEWFLYDQESPWAGSARGLARGEIYTHDGHLAVSVMQEGLIRVPQ
jgi:acyl-CoA thioesterase-2